MATIESPASYVQYAPFWRTRRVTKILVTVKNNGIFVREDDEEGIDLPVEDLQCNGIQLRLIVSDDHLFLVTDAHRTPMPIVEMFRALGGSEFSL